MAIPTYEMNGLGVRFLEHSLKILGHQTYKDFDVVISDHSVDNRIESLCKNNVFGLDIKYYRNEAGRGSSSANLNNAILKSTGSLIKILFQDDFLYSLTSLGQIAGSFDLERDKWHVTACEHSKDGTDLYRPFYPSYNHQIHLGNNTISSPSVLTVKNDIPLLFDHKLVWLMDCDYYKRLYLKFGQPKILNQVCVVNRIGGHQVSNTIATRKVRRAERKYVTQKFSAVAQCQITRVMFAVDRLTLHPRLSMILIDWLLYLLCLTGKFRRRFKW